MIFSQKTVLPNLRSDRSEESNVASFVQIGQKNVELDSKAGFDGMGDLRSDLTSSVPDFVNVTGQKKSPVAHMRSFWYGQSLSYSIHTLCISCNDHLFSVLQLFISSYIVHTHFDQS